MNSLVELVDYAQPYSVINLLPRTYRISKTLWIDKPLTILGNGSAIKAQEDAEVGAWAGREHAPGSAIVHVTNDDCVIKNLMVEGQGHIGNRNDIAGIRSSVNAHNLRLENVSVVDVEYACIFLAGWKNQVVRCDTDQSFLTDDQWDASRTNYGIVIAGRNCEISHTEANGARHGLTFTVDTRYQWDGSTCSVRGGRISSNANVQALSMKSGAWNCRFDGVEINGGVAIGGSGHDFFGCRILARSSHAQTSSPIWGSGELDELDHTFSHCRFRIRSNPAVMAQGIAHVMRPANHVEGTHKMLIKDCRFVIVGRPRPPQVYPWLPNNPKRGRLETQDVLFLNNDWVGCRLTAEAPEGHNWPVEVHYEAWFQNDRILDHGRNRDLD